MLETIGHYRIRQKIGQGAMGVVYERWDGRLQRPVAVKTIDKTNESSAARSRLWREARSLARVHHPNVCQVYDVLEEGGVLCTSTIACDAWFASLRSDPRYAAPIQAAQHRRCETHAAFLAAGGVQVISIA
jgi:hypothetical protein